MNALVALLTRPVGDDLGARIAWIQEAIVAVDAATADGSLDGEAIALDLRASLGAIVAWGRGPRDPESLLQLQGLVTGLLGRATSTLHRTLAAQWRQLAADGDIADREKATALSAAFARAAEAIERGDAVDADVAALLRENS